jgi:hypothetical protein
MKKEIPCDGISFFITDYMAPLRQVVLADNRKHRSDIYNGVNKREQTANVISRK